ncbi:MAG: cbb3-type cytochrome oxidase assembly protein [Puniceicoccales bacterium]
MFEWNAYLIILAVLGGTFFASAVAALWWSAKNGQLRNFDQGSRVVFTDEEPEGVHTDYFPGEAARASRKLQEAERR